MRVISIGLMTFLFLAILSCAVGSFPPFPISVTKHYMIDIEDQPIVTEMVGIIQSPEKIPDMRPGQIVRCMQFEITSKIPYKLQFLQEVPLKECHQVGGYKPDDAKSIYNWMSDVHAWAEDRKKCFK